MKKQRRSACRSNDVPARAKRAVTAVAQQRSGAHSPFDVSDRQRSRAAAAQKIERLAQRLPYAEPMRTAAVRCSGIDKPAHHQRPDGPNVALAAARCGGRIAAQRCRRMRRSAFARSGEQRPPALPRSAPSWRSHRWALTVCRSPVFAAVRVQAQRHTRGQFSPSVLRGGAGPNNRMMAVEARDIGRLSGKSH